jgi:hypothetical protein
MAEQPVRHHTVPAGYLRGFLLPQKPLLTVQTRNEKSYRKRPEEIAIRRHYHSVHKPDGTMDTTPETVLAEQVEDEGLTFLRAIANRRPISHFGRARLSVYLAIQYLRTPFRRDDYESVYAALLNTFSKKLVHSPQFERFLIQHQGHSPEDAKKLADETRHAVLNDKIVIEPKPESSLAAVSTHCRQIAEVLSQMKWDVLVANEDAFITSDCPVYFGNVGNPDSVGLLDPATVIHFPLTRNALLVIRHEEPEESKRQKLIRLFGEQYAEGFVLSPFTIDYIPISTDAVGSLNIQTARSCYEEVFCPDDSHDYSEVLREPPETVTSLFEDIGGGYVQVRNIRGATYPDSE